MDKKLKINKQIIMYMYTLCLLGMFLILGLVLISREKKYETKTDATYKNITAEWFLDKEYTSPVNVKKLGEYMDKNVGVLSMYYQLPETSSDISLIYRSKDVYTRVLSENEVLYQTNVYESKYYNKSPGNLWNVLTINSKYSGKCIEIEINMVYDTDALTVDSIFLGDKADIILGLFGDNIWGIIISLLMILLGFGLIVMDCLPSYEAAKKNHALFWIGIFSLFTGMWSLLETNVIQFCVKDMRILQLVNNMLMIIDSIPVLLYLNNEYEIFKYRIMRIIGYISTIYIMIAIFVQLFAKNMDFHHMLTGSILLMIVTDVVLFIWIIITTFKLRNDKSSIIRGLLQLTGLCSLWFCGVFEGIRSLNVDRMDRAGLIRVGMLILCLCLATSSQIEAYKIVEQGLQFDFVSKLAYSDGLTGLGNRTAYLEQIANYCNSEDNNSTLGIIYLDVNNLKQVNDGQGHEFGDKLIRLSAYIIDETFGHYGKSYRIGGDEFCVLLTGDNVKENYNEGLLSFVDIIKEANTAKWYPFPIQIAHGFAICDKITPENIQNAISQADNEMYANKQLLKELNKTKI